MTRPEQESAIIVPLQGEVFMAPLRTPEEIIAGISSPILAVAVRRSAILLTTENDRWYQFVQEQQQKFADKPNVIGQFTFTDDPQRPFSRDVNRFCKDLVKSGVLTERYSLKYKPELVAWEPTATGGKIIDEQLGHVADEHPEETMLLTQAVIDSLGVQTVSDIQE